MGLPRIDLADHLSSRVPPEIMANMGAHISPSGMAAFSTRQRDSAIARAAVYDSQDRVHLSVWLQDGLAIRAGSQRIRVNGRAMVAGYTPGEAWECAYGVRSHHVGLLVRPETLAELADADADPFIRRLGARGDVVSLAADASILRAAHELDAVLHTAGASALLKEAKSLELLARALHLGLNEGSTALSALDVRRLNEARELLLSDLRHAPSIDALARTCGINVFKLKRGFKALFGSTIHAAFQSERMQRAWSVLCDEDVSVAEVGELVGYVNLSHFAEAFRKAHGILPSEVRRRSRT